MRVIDELERRASGREEDDAAAFARPDRFDFETEAVTVEPKRRIEVGHRQDQSELLNAGHESNGTLALPGCPLG